MNDDNAPRKRPTRRKPADPADTADPVADAASATPPGKVPDKSPGKPSGRAKRSDLEAGRDIAPLLKGWDYESGTINVRKITGGDGTPKLQMRLDLGLLQMDLVGRPDGARPHGCESLLAYFQGRLDRHRRENDGEESGFALSPEQCQMLREEAVMYYHRYLSLFVLRDYAGVVRDTARNLKVLDLCGKFAVEQDDQLVLEQYRPYIVMMHARAAASVKLAAGEFDDALRIVRRGLRRIKRFYARFGHAEAYAESGEARVLRKLLRRVKSKIPVDPLTKLRRDLDSAVDDERYERAAELRDEIEAMTAA